MQTIAENKTPDIENKKTPEQTPANPPQETEKYPETPKETQQIQAKEDEGTAGRTIAGLKNFFQKQPKPSPAIPQMRDAVTIKIEKIMEENLTDAYRALPPFKQQEFKLKGERTAYAIRDLLKKTHIKIKKILKLIIAWLMMLPGVNRYFLEQEAKIKADKIIALKNIRED